MKRRKKLSVVMQLAARAFHRELQAAPASRARIVRIRELGPGRHVVQRDRNGDAYPVSDLRRCWRPDGVYRTPLLTAFEVKQS